MAGDEHDRGRVGEPPQQAGERHALDLGHVDVEEQRVVAAARQVHERLLGARGRGHAIDGRRGLEQVLDVGERARLVVDGEDRQPVAHATPPAIVAGDSAIAHALAAPPTGRRARPAAPRARPRPAARAARAARGRDARRASGRPRRPRAPGPRRARTGRQAGPGRRAARPRPVPGSAPARAGRRWRRARAPGSAARSEPVAGGATGTRRGRPARLARRRARPRSGSPPPRARC